MAEAMRSSQEQEKEVSFHCQSDQAIRGRGHAKDESGLLWSLILFQLLRKIYNRFHFLSIGYDMLRSCSFARFDANQL